MTKLPPADYRCPRSILIQLMVAVLLVEGGVQSFVFHSHRTTDHHAVVDRHPAVPFHSDWALPPPCPPRQSTRLSLVGEIFIVQLDDDDDDDGGKEEPEDEEEEEDDEWEDPYRKVASSEFGTTDEQARSSSALTYGGDTDSSISTNMDWGGALGSLRQRLDDIETGKAGNPSQALFRLMSSESPNQSIVSFIRNADPQVIQAMSGAVSSLLGGLSSPQSGIEVMVKSTGDKIGSLCFQLQMTGCVFCCCPRTQSGTLALPLGASVFTVNIGRLGLLASEPFS